MCQMCDEADAYMAQLEAAQKKDQKAARPARAFESAARATLDRRASHVDPRAPKGEGETALVALDLRAD